MMMMKFQQFFQKYNMHRITALRQILNKHKRTYYSTATSSRARAKIWLNYTHKANILQHSYSQTSVELGQKFGQMIQQDKPNTTAQPLQELQWS